jgi:outer membrane protein
MHDLLRKTVFGFLLITLLSASAHAQSRIATVDLRKIFDGYWKTKQADAALKDRAADMEKEHKSMLDDWKKAKEDYQTLLTSANDQAVSSDQRDKRKKLAEDKLKQIKESEDNIGQYERTAKQTLDDQRKRMRDNILGEIRTALNAKARSAAYSLAIDTAAESVNNTPVVLYTSNENDMTDAILSQLNAGAPAETPATDSKPADNKNEKKSEKKK